MGRIKWKRRAALLFGALLLLWPVYQMTDLYQAKTQRRDAGYLLYQAALFQMELLKSSLHEAAGATETAQLNALKQAAYSARFVHGKLAAAMGSGKVAELDGLEQLLQVIMRLQIGGERQLEPDEKDMLREAAELGGQLYASYGKLLTTNGELVPSSAESIKNTDDKLAKLMREKLER